MRIIVFVLLLLSLAINYGLSQGCCNVSVPTLSITETSTISLGSVRVSLSYLLTNTSSFFAGKQKVPDPLFRKAFANNFSLNVDIGLFPNFNISLFLPYNHLSRSSIFNSSKIQYTNKGIGDISLFFKYSPLNDKYSFPITLVFAGGLKFPTGDFLTEKDGVQLPIDIQPGTGSFDYIILALVSYDLLDELTFTQSFFYKLAGSNSKGYDIANELISNTGFYINLNEFLTLSLLGRLQIRGYDKLEDQIVVNSGRTLIEGIPSIILKFHNYFLRSYFCFPAYIDVNGSQLTPTWRIGVEISYQIFLF